MSYNHTAYTNYLSTYRFNPNNFNGSDKEYVLKHNSNISNRTKQSSCSSFCKTESNNNFTTNSSAYISHSYYGNSGNIISSCIG
jgi:hypothetical protein